MIRLYSPLAMLIAVTLGACSSVPEVTSFLTPYRIDVRQGNMVTQEMVAQLKVGQSKDQVRFILGTPLVNDMFHSDRWDYVYRFQPGKHFSEVQQRRLIVFFENGKLARLGGDVVADADAVSAKDVAAKAPQVIDIGADGKATKPAAEPSAATAGKADAVAVDAAKAVAEAEKKPADSATGSAKVTPINP